MVTRRYPEPQSGYRHGLEAAHRGKGEGGEAGQGLAQERLAGVVGKAVETISNIERGHALSGLDTLQKIGVAVGVPMTYFFEGLDDGRCISKGRLEAEEQLRSLGRLVREQDMPLAIALVKTVIQHKKR